MIKTISAGLGALALLGLVSVPAKADLKLCNNTGSRVQIAVGYKDKDGWASEGWWRVDPAANGQDSCKVILSGPLIARYYYIYALDSDKGGSWGGKAMICTQRQKFTIRGIENCAERGYQKQGFFEVDTNEQTDWTVSLSGDKTTQGQ